MTRMKPIANFHMDVLVGGTLEDIQCHPMPPYSAEAINFLSELSKRLLKNPVSRIFPDVTGFAYWCRKANLARLERGYSSHKHRLGRGIVLHIAPANVPVNFAFSLAFGMLAGNANIVRIPSVYHAQAVVICEEIAEIFKDPSYSKMAGMTRIIRYERQDEITAKLSSICHARVLWGGDATIKHFRSMPTAPRCVDVCFSDRYSICLLKAEAILHLDQNTLNTLIAGFYNDVFLFNQNACSSPHLILWQGRVADINSAKQLFWRALENALKSKAPPAPLHAIDKYVSLCRAAISLNGIKLISDQVNRIYRISLDFLPRNIDKYRGQHGFFFEAIDNDLKGFESIVSECYQTATYFGVDPDEIIRKIFSAGLTGIDRVVPVGKALDIGVEWDGYDVVEVLSRIISLN